MYVCMYVCMYVYVYTHTHTHTHTQLCVSPKKVKSDIEKYILFYLFIFFWLSHVALGILVPQPGIEPSPPHPCL